MTELSQLATRAAYLEGQALVDVETVAGLEAHLANLLADVEATETALTGAREAADASRAVAADAHAEHDSALDEVAAASPTGAVTVQAGAADASASAATLKG